jgi:hypothetical protein
MSETLDRSRISLAQRTGVGPGALWLPLLLGPAIWGLTEIVLSATSQGSCYTGFVPLPVSPGTATVLRLFSGIWVVVATVLAALAVLLAIRSWRVARNERGADDPVRSRVHFMALAGLITSSVFLYGIVMYGIGVAMLGVPCG